MSQHGNKTTMIAFASELRVNDTWVLPPSLETWRRQPWGNRVYVATQRGLYFAQEGPGLKSNDASREWWTFDGVSKVLREGAGSLV